jgi:2-(3-amino-3-carboxypropyl)histidine synthase
MKLFFIPVQEEVDIKPILKKVKIKGKVGLVAALQHMHLLKEVQKKFPDSIIAGQILGCNFENAEKIKDKVTAFLYIGSGPFHPLGLAQATKMPAYIINPTTQKFSKVDEADVIAYEKRKQGLKIKYLHAEKPGLIVSVKPHQQKWHQTFRWKDKLKKKSYIFLTNTLDKTQMENFTDIDVWVNTACPRIEDVNMINIADVLELEK